MNARVLELIKNPDLFQTQDLDILSLEIKKYPYVQNIRALHLYGIHKLNPEEYHNALSTTAAYTTDKKILYQFINKNSALEKKPHTYVPELQKSSEENRAEIFPAVQSVQQEQPKPVYVHGALNRILFEGEEDFLERKNEVIDLESTLESGQIITQSPDNKPNESYTTEIPKPVQEPTEVTGNIISESTKEQNLPEEAERSFPIVQTELRVEKEIQPLQPETIIEEDNSLKNDIVEDPAEISFHGTQEFLSEVKIVQKPSPQSNYEVPKPQLNKHEIEMQRLIAEVEAKMKSRKKPETEEKEEETQNTGLNFSETQSFEVAKPQENTPQETVTETEEEIVSEVTQQDEEAEEIIEPVTKESTTSSENKPWKPMSFAGNTPDALIGKDNLKNVPKTAPAQPESEKTQTVSEIPSEEKSEERPVFNVSFFATNVSPIESDKTNDSLERETVKPEDSNVPTFINTWQNWLKIDRSKSDTEQKAVLSKTEVKNTVIENFIVKEPKISKLKEESDFVVKEKSDNISHLMTETLAKLYVEQKLYSKAIKAYQILSEKHPEKESHFAEQISYVKDLRLNK
ncbi:MAG: hypothetical protein I8H68_01015 [Flavobacteriia bacterium]|nr:hypothetical protein [Flavobacteriia bacterium]MBH2023251.1 hypothetical protein [Flavobacteriales bacterium]